MDNTEVSCLESRVVEELSGSYNHDGKVVSVRCIAVSYGEDLRYELILELDGEVAIVDIAGSEQPALAQRIDQAVCAFVEAYKLR